MKNIYCPNCKKILMKAEFGDIEILCQGCKRLVNIRIWTTKSLNLTTDKEADSIEAEGNDSKK